MKRYILILVIFSCFWLYSADFYISAARGSGQAATKENPARDMGNIIHKLMPGDTVYIAAGIYSGKGENGCDIINVPVKIIGGYDDSFTTRDPWGKNKTIMSGNNKTKNYISGARIEIDLMKYTGALMPEIIIDGLIIDHAGRNRYKDEKELVIVRNADPKSGANPTPDNGGILIRLTGAKDQAGMWNVVITNCIIMNTAPTQGAMALFGYKGTNFNVKNNCIINNTGVGIFLGTTFHGNDNMTKYKVSGNSILFTSKYDPIAASFSGNSIQTDAGVVAELSGNVFAFADKFGIQKNGKEPLVLKDNIITGDLDADYYETSNDAKMDLEKVLDEAQFISPDSKGNIKMKITVPVSPAWAANYASRIIIDRKAVEADIKAFKSKLNDIRSMLGLPLQADEVKTADSAVWLNRITVDDAVAAGSKKYNDKYGSVAP